MTRTLRVLALLVVAFAVLTAGTGRAETPEAPAAPPHRLADEAPALHALLDELLEGRPYAGLSLGVSFEGERWTAARGWADVTKKRKATERTSYRMASVTKMFTAVAVMQLVEQGRIDLDEDIRTYVPSFPKKAWTVTPRHLLGHLGGISHYRDREKETHFHRRYTTAESLAIFQDWALEAPPGDQYVYTSYGYNLLGAAIERASGQSYAQYLRSRVFRPVEMTSSMVEDLRARDRTWARGYRMLRARVRSSEQVDISSRFAGGGTRSTVVDMLRFGEGLLAEKLLRRETLRRMQLPMATNAGEVTDYGMGMAAYPLGGRWVTAHAGAQPETSTLLMIFPAEQLVIAVAQNLEDQWTFNHRLAGRIAEVLLFGGERRRGLQGRTMADHLMSAGVVRVFSHGVARYRLQGSRIDEGTGDLLASMEEVDRLLEPEALARVPAEGWEAIQLGLGPKASAALPEVGAYMAAVLVAAHGPEALDRYGPGDAFGFFRDYFSTCEALDCPTALVPGPRIRTFIDRVGPAFEEAYPKSLRHLDISASSQPEVIREMLTTTFGHAPVVPDMAWELRELGEDRLKAGDLTSAKAWTEVARDLFPQDTTTVIQLAFIRYADRDPARGDALLGLAATMPMAEERLTSARLRFEAWQLERAGFDDGARDLIAFATTRYPEDAGLWDLLAKRREATGDLSGALAALDAAEALGPKRDRRLTIQRLRARLAQKR